MAEFSRYNQLPRYVVSTTLNTDDQQWPATILRSTEDVAQLKQTEGDPLLIRGSATLVHSLIDANLVDKYHLLIFPKLLGAGKRLFPTSDVAAKNLTLVESETYANGIIKAVYHKA